MLPWLPPIGFEAQWCLLPLRKPLFHVESSHVMSVAGLSVVHILAP